MTKRCAILCSGPSLKDHDLSRIDCTTIGTNLSYLTHQADVQVFTHWRLTESLGDQLVRDTPQAMTRFCAITELDGCYTPTVIWKHNTVTWKAGEKIPHLPQDYDIHRDGWIFCGGAPCALQVAISMKYSEIIFIGLDLNVERGLHSYPDEVFAYTARETLHTGYDEGRRTTAGYIIQIDFLQQFKPQLDDRGIKVINTSLRSTEQVFEKRPFDEIWPA